MTMNQRTGLQGWRDTLRKADDSPYVGPRPQTFTRDRGMLIGREADLKRIEEAVINRSLVVLDGGSGVGKSSLLQNGLYGVLEGSGFGVLVNRQWKATGDPLDSDRALDRYLVDGIRRTHKTLGLHVPEGLDAAVVAEGRRLHAWVDESRGDTATVLILDQFEELFRQHGERAQQVVKWAIDAGFQSSLRVVLSLRTDSLHRLDELIRGVKPYSMDRIRLAEIAEESDIRQVMRTPRRGKAVAGGAPKKSSRIAMTDPAVDRLMVAWRAHTPKLLDLQATLYTLYFRAKDRVGKRTGTGRAAALAREPVMIEPADIAGLAAEVPGPRRRGKVPNLFAVGLREAIRLKIDHAAGASRAAKLDPYLLSGTMEAVKRIAPLLSSSDFKVPIHEFDLAKRTLDREMRVLERSLLEENELATGETAEPRRPWLTRNRVAERLYRALVDSGDLLAARHDQIEPLQGLQEKIDKQAQPPGRWNAPAGPMLYQTAMATLFEELRRVAFAIEWLEATEIARKDSDGILLLIHDRSGEAFQAWADAQEHEPFAALHLLTGARGEHFVWMGKGEGIGNLDPGAGHHEVIANVNWRDCRITTRFRRIVFVNCDFTGSRFDGCTFEGVTFLNCILNGATFEACEIRGTNDQAPLERPASKSEQKGGKRRLAPSFTVQAREDEVRTFSVYRGADGRERSWFFSDTSGVAAVPGGRPRGHTGELLAHFETAGDARGTGGKEGRSRPGRTAKVTPTTGGVTMVGGLLHFLTVVRCSARPKPTEVASRRSSSSPADGGAFSFHHVSGGGLDIVEQREGRIDIHDGVLRGVSVTRDRDGAEVDPGSGSAAGVKLAVNDSFVFNVYFSEELTGSADIQNSVVVMLLNASDASRFPVQLQNCRYQAVVNTEDPQGSSEDSKNLRKSQGPPYFAQYPGYDSRFSLPNRELLASDLEAMDFRSKPEAREAAQRGRSALHPSTRALAAADPRAASRSPDEVAPSTMEQES